MHITQVFSELTAIFHDGIILGMYRTPRYVVIQRLALLNGKHMYHFIKVLNKKEIINVEDFIKFLSDVVPAVDFENCTKLIDEKILTSLDILTIVSEIEDEYDVELSPADLTPANFNSAASLWALVQKYL